MGCAAFAMELFAQEAMIKSWTEAQKEWARSIPSWIYFVYGIAVTSGVAGCVCLLMRKGRAVPLFAICLVAVIVQMSFSMIIYGGMYAMGPSALVMPLLVIVIAAALLWFSRFAKSRNWIAELVPIFRMQSGLQKRTLPRILPPTTLG